MKNTVQTLNRWKSLLHFFSFSKDKKKKNTQKESNLAESTAIADATRFIVTSGRVLLWKSRGTALTRKDYVLSRKGKINHSSTDNLTKKTSKILDSTYWKGNTNKT